MARSARGGLTVTRGGLGALVCALAAHGALYRSFLPSDGVHGYFAWYEPLVGALSVAAIATVAVLFMAALAGRRPRVLAWIAGRDTERSSTLPDQSLRLASVALGVLLVQETVERSVGAGSPTVPMLTPTAWLSVLVALALVAAMLVFATRSCAVLLEHVLAAPPPAPVLLAAPGAPPRAAVPCARLSPLASSRALRAPPLLAG